MAGLKLPTTGMPGTFLARDGGFRLLEREGAAAERPGRKARVELCTVTRAVPSAIGGLIQRNGAPSRW
jgi:hypothetical protein